LEFIDEIGIDQLGGEARAAKGDDVFAGLGFQLIDFLYKRPCGELGPRATGSR
jgi:hypothetical protein